ncbi:hypothetical protein [Microbacterium neungamense]|uniref:hypothetical protein n=1 Tax=Microbacterium neungamense TaxID=2810535 RepID=UPI00217CFC56|nr:hypothetical protein [Microbacterium neungamense]UWF77776.1 hypothetical protein JSY13_01505 [Microbacterium neungamense]
MSVLADHTRGYAEAAHLVAGLPSHGDDRVPEGVHWRVIPASGTVPAGPIVVCDAAADPSMTGIRTDRPGDALGDVAPGRALLLLIDVPPDRMAGWVRIRGEGRLRVAVIADRLAPNGADIEITARDEEPWIVASSDIARVRVTGEGRVHEAEALHIPRDTGRPLEVLQIASLDTAVIDRLDGCYAYPQAGADTSTERVLAGAPLVPLPYAPRHPWPEYTADDELRRVAELVEREGIVLDWLHKALAAALGDESSRYLAEAVGADQELRYSPAAALGVAAADPGVARWLARQGMLPAPPARWQEDRPSLAMALMPVIVPGQAPERTELAEVYDEVLGGGLSSLRDELARRASPEAPLSVEVLALPMPLVLGAPPALPLTPQLRVFGRAEWTVERAACAELARTTGWEQSIALGGTAPFGPVSLVRLRRALADPERTTMHDAEGPVASPLLPAWPQPAAPGVPPAGDATVRGRQAVASPGEAVPARWEVRLEDWMGRWGDPAEIEVAPPSPALPAKPVLRATFVRTPVTGEAAASPGVVRVELVIAPPSAPGALPVTAASVRIDGAPVALTLPDLSAGTGIAVHEHVVPATLPGQSRTIRVEGWITDASSADSPHADPAVITASDARPVPVPTVSPRLLPAGRPGPAPEVAVTLSIRAVEGAALYRFYTASEGTVRAQFPGLDSTAFRNRPRAVRAQELLARGLPPREGFTLAQAVPVVAGTATATLLLPSASSDLVLVRAVPVTGALDAYGKIAEGVEAPPHTVAPAYIVVPSVEVPPVPRVAAEVDDGGTVTVRVEVSGVPANTLARLPGALEARLVEAIPGTEPFYWPEVKTLTLVDAGSGVFSGSAPLSAPRWARIRLAASARYAAEDMVVPDADIVLTPDLTASGGAPDDVVSPWGPLSAPVTLDVPGAEPSIRSEASAAGIRVSVDGLPLIAQGSSAFTAVVYREGADAALIEYEQREVSGETAEFDVPGGAAAAVALRDPFGAARPPVRVGPT